MAVDQNGNIYFTDLYTYSLIEESLTSGNFGSVSVGYSSYPVSMFFTFDTSGFMQSAAVSTQGAAALDFTDAGTGDLLSGKLWSRLELLDRCGVHAQRRRSPLGCGHVVR